MGNIFRIISTPSTDGIFLMADMEEKLGIIELDVS